MLTAIETTATIGANRQLLLDEDLPENVSVKSARDCLICRR